MLVVYFLIVFLTVIINGNDSGRCFDGSQDVSSHFVKNEDINCESTIRIRQFHLNDFNECADMCLASNGCAGFIVDKTDGKCQLRTSNCIKKSDTGFDFYKLTADLNMPKPSVCVHYEENIVEYRQLASATFNFSDGFQCKNMTFLSNDDPENPVCLYGNVCANEMDSVMGDTNGKWLRVQRAPPLFLNGKYKIKCSNPNLTFHPEIRIGVRPYILSMNLTIGSTTIMLDRSFSTR